MQEPAEICVTELSIDGAEIRALTQTEILVAVLYARPTFRCGGQGWTIAYAHQKGGGSIEAHAHAAMSITVARSITLRTVAAAQVPPFAVLTPLSFRALAIAL